MDKVALIGSGLVGRGWAIVFARAGGEVALFDADPPALEAAVPAIEASLADLKALGLVDDPAAVGARIRPAASLAEALRGAAYVQESVAEDVAVKLAVFEELDAVAEDDAVLASSTSGIPASAFTERLARRRRCLVAHPLNPPYLIPLVELCPAPWTDPAAVERARAVLEQAGQVPVLVRREVEGFIVNRLQGALLHAAFALVEEGVAGAEDVDRAVKHGLGLRWSFMGPFETIDLNAPGGIADYVRRYGPLYLKIAQDQGPAHPWGERLLARIERERRELLPESGFEARKGWRDRRLMALSAHKRDARSRIGD
ncbi:MAG TPA: 3-hydroxyacyl-CoA dehydrogenase [Geminicoccaceae bacterium]|nr:3-hydroxyacyl-CoA dehydrogenase [Geminicoccaceae bacterium]